MWARWLVLLAVLFFPVQARAASEPVSVFDARPISIVIETSERLSPPVQDKLLELYRWTFRLPAYDKQPFSEPIALKKGYNPLQDRKGNIAAGAVREHMAKANLQRLVLLRIDELSSFIYHHWSIFDEDDVEIEEARVQAVATLVDQDGRVLLQRKIRRWERREYTVDSGPVPLLLEEWERFLKEAGTTNN